MKSLSIDPPWKVMIPQYSSYQENSHLQPKSIYWGLCLHKEMFLWGSLHVPWRWSFDANWRLDNLDLMWLRLGMDTARWFLGFKGTSTVRVQFSKTSSSNVFRSSVVDGTGNPSLYSAIKKGKKSIIPAVKYYW